MLASVRGAGGAGALPCALATPPPMSPAAAVAAAAAAASAYHRRREPDLNFLKPPPLRPGSGMACSC